MSSEYRPIGKSNYLNYQKQIQTVQQDHNPRIPLPETSTNEIGLAVENFVTISEKALEQVVYDELRCPICLGIFESTLTLSTCLHRFCSECFQRSMRELKSQHGCPQCRAKLSSRRVSKPDTAIDSIIHIFMRYLPSMRINGGTSLHSADGLLSGLSHSVNRESNAAIDGSEGGANDTANPTSPTAADTAALIRTNSASKRSKRQSSEIVNQETEQIFEIEKYRIAYLKRVEEFKQRQKEIKTQPPTEGTHYYQQFFSSSDRSYLNQPNQRQRQAKGNKALKTSSFVNRRVFLALCPVPQWKPDEEAMPAFVKSHAVLSDYSLKLPYLKVNAELNVGELKQFLQLKLQFTESAYNRIEILFPNQNQVKQNQIGEDGDPIREQWVILDECLTVLDIIDCLWNKSSELIFYYRLSDLEFNATEQSNEAEGKESNPSKTPHAQNDFDHSEVREIDSY